jgi:hypothetical protein
MPVDSVVLQNIPSQSQMPYLLLIPLLTFSLAVPLYGTGFAEAKDLYFRGVDGDRSASRDSTKILEKLAAEKPGDAVVLVYLASNKLLESGRTFALWNKNRLAKEGITGLDRAVEMAPDNLEIRFIRAVSTFDLPGFFKRQQQSEADFEWLAPRVTAEAKKGTLEKRFAAASLYYFGLVLERRGDKAGALKLWRSAAEMAPDSKAGTAAAAKLR